MIKKYMLGTSLRMIVWMTLLTGFLYPLLIWIAAQGFWYEKANGSLVYVEEVARGSRWIGQKFHDVKYFWSRPSAIDYNPLPSGGSNLSPTSAVLKAQVEERTKMQQAAHGGPPPSDLLYASGSGLDPHISPHAAYYQLERVAKARGLDTEEEKNKLKALIEKFTKRTLWGFIGDDRVNVLLLNQALDELSTPSKS
jgi:K+-transporting ATPase ATPase C chain